MAWREELHPRDNRGRFAPKGTAPAVSIKATLADLTKASEDDLFDVFHRISSRKRLNTRELQIVADELARREELAKLPPPADTPEQQQIDQLVGRGMSYAEAFSEAYGRSGGRDRDTGTRAQQRKDYRQLVALEALQAEEATRGHLVEKRCRGVDPATLWSAAPDRARKCATEELQRWWQANGGRKTFAVYQAMLGGRRAATVGSRGDFGT